jgi:DNA polymerase-4
MPSVREAAAPHALFLRGDYQLYSDTSAQVHEIFHAVTPLVEPIAWTRPSSTSPERRRLGSGGEIAAQVRSEVSERLGLACSVGVASTKLVAKLASEAAKPKVSPAGVRPGPGVVVVASEDGSGSAGPSGAGALGVGPATLERLRRLGVSTVETSPHCPRRRSSGRSARRTAATSTSWRTASTIARSSPIDR